MEWVKSELAKILTGHLPRLQLAPGSHPSMPINTRGNFLRPGPKKLCTDFAKS